MKQIAQAIQNVMNDIKGIEKNLNVGSGQMSYKGVSDKDVKQIVGEAMHRHGLCIIPTGVEAQTHIDRWEETSQYGNKMKQSILTEVKTKYLLLHLSGESIELQGYGHGVDSQDKSAGKATTYALKYALLYVFMIPTGKIDDADNTHSDEVQPRKAAPAVSIDISHILPAIEAATTQEALKAVWEANANLHAVQLFKQAITNRKSQIL
jgi:bacterioferritin-associated ferredoxin